MRITVLDKIKINDKFMTSYLCWRVLSGLHKKITLHFLVVGHKKIHRTIIARGVYKDIPPYSLFSTS